MSRSRFHIGTWRPRLAVLATLLWVAAAATGGPDSARIDDRCIAEEPDEYRMRNFRAPTPCSVRGAAVISTPHLERLLEREHPLLIDVLPAQRRPKHVDGPWLPPPRANIPGSVWLPNTGFGVLPLEEERYFRDNLKRLTRGNLHAPIVIYCERQCWMSWNAARRAAQWGYRQVYWYPGGTDAWAAAGHPLQESTPVIRGLGH